MNNTSNEEIKEIKKFSHELKKNVLEMAYCAGATSSHFGGALSILDIVATTENTHLNRNNAVTPQFSKNKKKSSRHKL